MRKRSNSLAGTINKQTAMIIFAVIASLTLLFASSISKKNNDDRAKLKNSLGAMIVRVIERPMSLNDYISVESAIKIAELPLFLKKLVVIDKEGVEVASFTNGDSPCRLEETTSFNISKRADSGQLILVETKCDLVSENFKLIAFAIAIGFLLISISFLTLKRLINKSLQPLLYIIKQSTSEGQIAKDLISSAPLEIIPLLEKIESAYNLQIDLKRKLEREQVARQVAHDIRSPLAGLRVALKDLPKSGDNKNIIQTSIKQIEDIANNLLDFTRESREEDAFCFPYMVVSEAIALKKLQLSDNPNLEIEFSSKLNFNICAIRSSEMHRILSNLINNSYESYLDADKRIIKVSLDVKGRDLVLEIKDHGIGIPASTLELVRKAEGSFNKTKGNGLGISHAIKAVRSIGGQFEIDSIEGKGTTVTIILPISDTNSDLRSPLYLKSDIDVLILDDEESFHDIWRIKLKELNKELRTHHFTTVSSLLSFLKDFQKEYFFISDYNLKNDSKNGIDVINLLQAQMRSLLVTSQYDDPNLILRCKESQISILPKNLVSGFEFLVNHEQTESYDAVHIDDDKYIRALWLKCAADQDVKILSLGKFDEIFKHLKNFNESIPIYIDSDLGSGTKGEILAKSLYDKGFMNLHISTGFSKSDFIKPDYISSVIGKDPPWG